MYPLLLKAPIKDYLWGGTKLKTDFGFETEKSIAAEAWMLSCHKDGMNTVLNGEYKGKTLNEVLEIWGKSALGKNSEKFSYFPILIKLIEFNCDTEYNIKIIAFEGQIEVYIDDVLVIQNAFKTQNMNFGLYVGAGECLFNNFKIYNLEN